MYNLLGFAAARKSARKWDVDVDVHVAGDGDACRCSSRSSSQLPVVSYELLLQVVAVVDDMKI